MGETFSSPAERKLDVDDSEEWSPSVDHPVNFVNFSEIVCDKKECLLLNVDQSTDGRRTKISFGNPKFNFTSYTCLSQIIGLLPDGRCGIGSSTRIMVKGVPYVLTCAHNLCGVSTVHESIDLFKKTRIYEGREGSDAWKQLWLLDLKKSSIHPKFNGKPYGGFDIGISRVLKRNHKFNGKVKIDDNSVVDDCELGTVNLKDIESGMAVEVTGYSGQKDLFGYPFTYEGKILDTKPTGDGGCIMFYKLDSIPGNSGGAIMIKNKSYIKKHSKKPGISKLIIGVHNGYDGAEDICYGTLITEAVLKSLIG